MDVLKSKPRRRVASYEEPPLRKVNVRLTAEERAHLLEIGEGNASLGARRAIEYMRELEETLSPEEWDALLKSHHEKRAPQRSIKARSDKPVGRPAAMAETVEKAKEMYLQGRTIKEISTELNMHQSTIYKYVDIRKKNL